jgi:heat shock protein Hsp15
MGRLMEKAPGQSLRLDKWLKIARIFKARSQATKACDEGDVKVNGERAKAAKLIKPGDKLTVKGKIAIGRLK